MKAEQLTNTWEPSFMTKALRLCSHQAWYPNLIMPVTNVNTPFFQVFIPKFGHTSNVEEYGFDLTLGHYMVISHLQYQLGLQRVWTQHYFMPVSRHQWTQPKITVLESHKSLGNVNIKCYVCFLKYTDCLYTKVKCFNKNNNLYWKILLRIHLKI